MSEHDGNGTSNGTSVATSPGDDLERVSNGGRPMVVLTDHQRTRLAAMAARGLTQDDAAAEFGICSKTLRRIFARDEDADLSWRTGRAELHGKIADAFNDLIQERDSKVVLYAMRAFLGVHEQSNVLAQENGAARVNVNITLPAARSPEDYAKNVSGGVVDVGGGE